MGSKRFTVPFSRIGRRFPELFYVFERSMARNEFVEVTDSDMLPDGKYHCC